MNHKFMWAYLIHLSTHMWQDETAEPGGTWYAGKPYDENNNVLVWQYFAYDPKNDKRGNGDELFIKEIWENAD